MRLLDRLRQKKEKPAQKEKPPFPANTRLRSEESVRKMSQRLRKEIAGAFGFEYEFTAEQLTKEFSNGRPNALGLKAAALLGQLTELQYADRLDPLSEEAFSQEEEQKLLEALAKILPQLAAKAKARQEKEAQRKEEEGEEEEEK